MDEPDDDWDMHKAMTRFRAPVDFRGAAIIDADGQEISITEDMIQEACNGLQDAWQFPCDCSGGDILSDLPTDSDNPGSGDSDQPKP